MKRFPKKELRRLGADLGRRLTQYGGPLHGAYLETIRSLQEEIGTRVLEAALAETLKRDGEIVATPTKLVVKLQPPKDATE